jgi:hypothetical protein
MTDPNDPLEEILERLTTQKSVEEKTLDDLARDSLRRRDDELTRNISELERLAGEDPG